MDEQVMVAVRSLPRLKLEALAVNAIADARRGREESARNSHFQVALAGVLLGGILAAAGFIAGAAFR